MTNDKSRRIAPRLTGGSAIRQISDPWDADLFGAFLGTLAGSVPILAVVRRVNGGEPSSPYFNSARPAKTTIGTENLPQPNLDVLAAPPAWPLT
jgi:hypothetical protein